MQIDQSVIRLIVFPKCYLNPISDYHGDHGGVKCAKKRNLKHFNVPKMSNLQLVFIAEKHVILPLFCNICKHIGTSFFGGGEALMLPST